MPAPLSVVGGAEALALGVPDGAADGLVDGDDDALADDDGVDDGFADGVADGVAAGESVALPSTARKSRNAGATSCLSLSGVVVWPATFTTMFWPPCTRTSA